MSAYQGDDDFAVRCGLEVVRLLQALPDKSMVVDLAIDGEDDGFIGIGQGLGPRL